MGKKNFLESLKNANEKNKNKRKQGYRYDEEVMGMAVYNRMIAGPLGYQQYSLNLGATLPSISAVNKHISKEKAELVEGVLRANELLKYLNERNLPKIVSLSEDATRIVGRVQYSRKTNQIVGFVPPLDRVTGMPITSHFPAKSAAHIEQICLNKKNEKASYAIVLMAQPLCLNTPSFCILYYGTNSKYKQSDIAKKWGHICEELKSLGITVLTISTDSDTRYNSVMRRNFKIGLKTQSTIFKDCNWISCDENFLHDNKTFYFQDMLHLVLKCRNSMLNNSLIIGKFKITKHHLLKIVRDFSKEKHNLTEAIVDPSDRQNFDYAQRIVDKKVINLLNQNVINSDGTVVYLQMMNNIIEALSNPELQAEQIIGLIWHQMFLFRIWRQHIKRSPKLTYKDNFISHNCYVCLEINAQSIILLIIYLKKKNLPELFITTLLGSQQCENLFRALRSMSSVYSTVTNMSVLEMMHRIKRVDLQNSIKHNLPQFEFPGNNPSSEQSNAIRSLPSEADIYKVLQSAKLKAVADAQRLGLKLYEDCSFQCDVLLLEDAIDTETESNADELEIDNPNILKSIDKLQIKNFAKKHPEEIIRNDTPYTEIISNGKRLVVKKTTLIWLLTSGEHLSNDRLKRVQSRKTNQ